MKFQYLIFTILLATRVFSQNANVDPWISPLALLPASTFHSFDKYTNAEQMLATSFVDEGRTNISVIVATPKPCPSEYTNLISNANLFSPEERKLIENIPSKFAHLAIDVIPQGTRLIGTNNSYPLLSDTYLIKQFQYINSGDQLEVIFYTGDRRHKPFAIGVSFRTKSGDGYEELFNHTYRGFRAGQLDGIWADFDRGRCASWMRFTDGKAKGKWLMWNRSGNLFMEMEFQRPYDFVGHLRLAP